MSNEREGRPPQEALQQIESEAMTREEIEEALSEVGMDEFIDMEMKRLGFWDPDTITESQKQMAELQTQSNALRDRLNELQQSFSAKKNVEARIQKDREKRIKASRERNQMRRNARKKAFHARKERWKKEKEQNILYLGEGVSNHLNAQHVSQFKLSQNNLPKLDTVPDLAILFGISVPQLRSLAFHRRVSKYNAYVRFSIPKKDGSKRIISAPRPELKRIQHTILEQILCKVPIHNCAHGFVPKRSILSNAQPHVGKAVVVNMDLEHFFPTLDYPRIKGCFISLGYSPQISTILALICTEAEVGEMLLEGEKWFIRTSERYLPQGAPTSPMLTNIICHSLDRRLEGFANKYQWTYTRYADDLTFSSTNKDAHIRYLCKRTQQIVEEEQFRIHPKKTKIMRSHTSQEVTGVVVNTKPTISRKKRKRFEALVHRLETKGPQECHWDDAEDVLAAALGFAAHIYSIDPVRGNKLLQRVKTVYYKYR